jgi:hypothetical protein
MDAIINTVSTIFKERYGAKLKVETEFDKRKGKPHFISQWKSAFVYSRTLRQVSFPIFNSKRELQAIVTASPVDNQDAIVFDEMAQFIHLTIAEHIEVREKHDLQRRAEEAFAQTHLGAEKVVQLKTRKQPLPQTFEYKKIKPKREADTAPIWISGDNEDFNAHIAFSIHDWISNWAFINAREIPDLVWQDPHAWQNFPQVTLFVPDISTLSQSKIETLKKNLEQLKYVQGQKPLIIVTSPKEISPELEVLKDQFKHYKANDKVNARVQAHFLLYHQKNDSSWAHHCAETNGIYFLPFSPGSKDYH